MANTPQDVTKLATNNDINLTDKFLTTKSSNDLKNTSLNDLFNNKELLNLLSVNLIDSIKLLFLGEYWFNVDNAFKDKTEVEKKITIGNIDFKKIYVLCNGTGIKPQYALSSVLGVTKTPDLSRGGVFYHYGSQTNSYDKGFPLGTWHNGGLPNIEWEFFTSNFEDNKFSPVAFGKNIAQEDIWVNYDDANIRFGTGYNRKRTKFSYSSRYRQGLPFVEGNKPLMDRLAGQWYILADIVKV